MSSVDDINKIEKGVLHQHLRCFVSKSVLLQNVLVYITGHLGMVMYMNTK